MVVANKDIEVSLRKTVGTSLFVISAQGSLYATEGSTTYPSVLMLWHIIGFPKSVKCAGIENQKAAVIYP